MTFTDKDGRVTLLGREPENENDTLAILWKLEAMNALPFARFQTLAHAGHGPDLIVHFQEDRESESDRYTVVEAERFFYNYKRHSHAPSQYPRVVCWDVGTKSMKVDKTTHGWKKVAVADGVQVNIFCIRYMPGIAVISREEANQKDLV